LRRLHTFVFSLFRGAWATVIGRALSDH
jgi:hypothetical protein